MLREHSARLLYSELALESIGQSMPGIEKAANPKHRVRAKTNYRNEFNEAYVVCDALDPPPPPRARARARTLSFVAISATKNENEFHNALA